MGRMLISVGLMLVCMGLFWQFGAGLGLGHLPGDITIKRGGSTIYLPIGTCILASLALSLISWLIRSLRG